MYGITASAGAAAAGTVISTQVPGPAGEALAATGFAFALYVLLGVLLIGFGLVLRIAGRRRPTAQE